MHRHFFERHSDYFVRLLSTYVFSEASHVFLPDVKKADFENLLSIFYPEYAPPYIYIIRALTHTPSPQESHHT